MESCSDGATQDLAPGADQQQRRVPGDLGPQAVVNHENNCDGCDHSTVINVFFREYFRSHCFELLFSVTSSLGLFLLSCCNKFLISVTKGATLN